MYYLKFRESFFVFKNDQFLALGQKKSFFHIFLVYGTNKSRRLIKFLKFTSNIVDIMQALIGKAAQFLFFFLKGKKKN